MQKMRLTSVKDNSLLIYEDLIIISMSIKFFTKTKTKSSQILIFLS